MIKPPHFSNFGVEKIVKQRFLPYPKWPCYINVSNKKNMLLRRGTHNSGYKCTIEIIVLEGQEK